MADPNFAACAEMLAFQAKILDELETYTSTASTGLIATVEAARNDIEGDYAQDTRGGLETILADVATPLTQAGARRLFDPILRQTAVAIGYAQPGAPISRIWEALVDYFVDNSQSLNDSEDTIHTSYTADGGNTGDGEVVVLTVDENSNTLGWIPDTSWTLKCTADARTLGEVGLETWTLEGSDSRPDNLDVDGTGTGLIVRGIRSISADLSKSYVRNPSFNDFVEDGSSQLTSLPGWTQNTGANLYTNLASNSTYAARPTPGESTSTSLQFNGDETIYQDLVSVAGAQIDPDTPFLIDVAIAKVGTPTGTFTLRLSGTVGSGGVSNTLAHTSMTGSGTFDRLRIAIGSNCWPKNFNANDLKLQIGLASSGSIDASNYFVVDDVLFAPLTRVGSYGDPRRGRGSMGIYLGVIPGSTAFIKDDLFTASDTVGGTRGVNHWALTKIARYGALKMVTGGTETIADK